MIAAQATPPYRKKAGKICSPVLFGFQILVWHKSDDYEPPQPENKIVELKMIVAQATPPSKKRRGKFVVRDV
jgi:hypothetical protein